MKRIILEELRKIFTTFMCFWMLTTEMPVNVVFADTENTTSDEEITETETGEESSVTELTDEEAQQLEEEIKKNRRRWPIYI